MRTTLRIALILTAALNLAVTPSGAGASTEGGSVGDSLSPFWGSAISQWTHWIVYWANERELDPDLVAAVVRKESVGRANAQGPYGSVGLMMVMPAEISGLAWRPSSDELKEPNVNLRWGTGMLKQIIRDSRGDLLDALAAYNGGWDQIHLTVTEQYARSVLTYYAYAIAARHGYSYQESKTWTMVLMTRVDGHITLIQTGTSGPFLAPCFEGALEFREIYPEMSSAPRTRVTHYVDDDGRDVFVDAWLFVGSPDKPADEVLVSAGPLLLPHSVRQP